MRNEFNANEITESEFIMNIDASFPYKDEVKWKSLIRQGASISPDASFMTLHEICRKPKYVHISEGRLLEMINYRVKNNDLPLQQEIVEAAKSLIQKTPLPKAKAKIYFRNLRQHIGWYNAAAIVLYAANERNRDVRTLYEDLLKHWKNA